jgi:SAM-dependent methyltransferase
MHQNRRIAESFGTDVERYDRTRPAYPAALVEAIIADRRGPDVVDVGCGTGIATRQFLAAGCTVLGVEPDVRMAEFARRSGIDVEVATFEDWDSAGRRFDAVIAGTAWHWVDPVAGAAKAARVLRPGGRLAPFLHVFQAPPEVIDALDQACRRAGHPADLQPLKQAMDTFQPRFGRIADGIRAAGGFSEPEQWRFGWERVYSRDEWLDQLPTHGHLNLLPPDKLKLVLTAVGDAIDAMGGSFTMAYTTVAITAVRGSARLNRGRGCGGTRRPRAGRSSARPAWRPRGRSGSA